MLLLKLSAMLNSEASTPSTMGNAAGVRGVSTHDTEACLIIFSHPLFEAGQTGKGNFAAAAVFKTLSDAKGPTTVKAFHAFKG